MTGYTDAYIEREIANEVRRNSGFSTFWVDENHRRAQMATDMFADGRLVSEDGQYPWVKCKVGSATPAAERTS